MITTTLNKKERTYVLYGLRLYEKEIQKDLENTKDPYIIQNYTDKIETIGMIKERLRRF